MTLGALTAGVPVAPVSVAYSLQSQDHGEDPGHRRADPPGGRVRRRRGPVRAALARPRWTAAGTPEMRRAPAAPGVIVSTGHRADAGRWPPSHGPEVEAALGRGRPRGWWRRSCSPRARPATPKGVLNTHGMMVGQSADACAQVWPFTGGDAAGHRGLAAVEPHVRRQPQLEHGAQPAAGRSTSTPGAPRPACSRRHVANLTEVPPTVYFNVPAGYGPAACRSWSATPSVRGAVLRPAAAAVQRGGRAARRAAGRGSVSVAVQVTRRPDAGHRVLGCHRDRPGGDRGALPSYADAGVHRGPAAGRAR